MIALNSDLPPLRVVKMMDDVSERIRTRRKQLRLSQEALEELTGISQSVISKYERAEMTPGAEYLRKLAQGLETTTDYLLSLSKTPEIPLLNPSVSDEYLRALRLFRMLTPKQRKSILSLMETLVEEGDDTT